LNRVKRVAKMVQHPLHAALSLPEAPNADICAVATVRLLTSKTPTMNVV